MKKEITTGKIFVVCLGDFARAVIGGLIVTYSLKFFNVTESSGLPLLLPIGLMGVLRGIGVVFDAVTDPWVANISDKCTNPRGRRILFMRWAAIPYALVCLLIFFPPTGSVSAINIIWVIVMLLLYYLFSTFYCVPFMALQQELVTDTRKRVFFYTINSLMFVLGSAVIYILPVMVSSLRSSGMAAITAWRISLAVFAVLGGVCALIPSLAIKEKDYVESKSCYKPILQSLKATFAYKNFSIMTVGYLIMQFGFAFFNTALLYYIDTLLGLKESFATIVLAISIVVGICTYPAVNALSRRFGKKPLLLAACISYVVIYLGIYLSNFIASAIGTAEVQSSLVIAFAGAGATVGNVTVAFLIGLLIAFPIACTNILPASAFADLAQYDTIKTGDNKTGMFVAARQFVTKLSQALVSVIVSYVMYIGTTDSYPTEKGVRLTALLAAICLTAAIAVYSRYDDRMVVSAIDQYNSRNAQAKTKH